MKFKNTINKKSFLLFLVLFSYIGLYSQTLNIESNKARKYLDERKEVFIGCSITDIDNVKNLHGFLSIDKVTADSVFIYANKDTYKEFLKLNIPFKTLTPPSLLKEVIMSDDLRSTSDWDSYPTYNEYVAMMQQFANNYPQICKLEVLGQSINGRDILAIKISDNVSEDEAETEFLYTSTMHGDELTGMVLTLRLIDDILVNYGSDINTTTLVDNLEIWVNPLSNPDGTYYLGNNTVNGATRFNENGIDLNRNFPDPENGLHPDGYPWQQETLVMMEFLNSRNFVMSANFHTGYEVVNYPWDTWPTIHADDMWYEYISRQYADTAQAYAGSLANYLLAENNGITNGYDWYTTNGSRQDFVNYFHFTREVTIEVSFTKTPNSNILPQYWEANRRSMYDYLNQCFTGLHGIVRDSINQEPIEAKIEILNHDFNYSYIFSEEETGYYHRLIYPGIYDLLVISPGYVGKIIENVSISGNSISELNINLFHIPLGVTQLNQNFKRVYSYPNPAIDDISLFYNIDEQESIDITIMNAIGKIVYSQKSIESNPGINQLRLSFEGYASGTYHVYLNSKTSSTSHKIIKLSK